MDGKTNITKRLPTCHEVGPERAPYGRSCDSRALRPLENIAAAVAVEIFKKTSYVADLKPGGRDVAKDMLDVGGIPLLIKTLLDGGHLDGDWWTVTGRAIAEIDSGVGTLNVKLTGAERAEGKTECKRRETNHRSGARRKFAPQVGPAVDGAVIRPGGAHEKQCYAGI